MPERERKVVDIHLPISRTSMNQSDSVCCAAVCMPFLRQRAHTVHVHASPPPSSILTHESVGPLFQLHQLSIGARVSFNLLVPCEQQLPKPLILNPQSSILNPQTPHQNPTTLFSQNFGPSILPWEVVPAENWWRSSVRALLG